VTEFSAVPAYNPNHGTNIKNNPGVSTASELARLTDRTGLIEEGM